jgi:aminoglycoside phosphotransferase (APT) family kinase protein
LIHNDYKFDNVVVADEDVTRIIGVLDWEMATLGDPLSDLGTAIGYWITLMIRRLKDSMGTNDAARHAHTPELVDRYAAKTGRDASAWLSTASTRCSRRPSSGSKSITVSPRADHDPRFGFFIEATKIRCGPR